MFAVGLHVFAASAPDIVMAHVHIRFTWFPLIRAVEHCCIRVAATGVAIRAGYVAMDMF